MRIRLVIACIAFLAVLFQWASGTAYARECPRKDVVKMLFSSTSLAAAPVHYAIANKLDEQECLEIVLNTSTSMSNINVAFLRGDVDFMEEMVLMNRYYGTGGAHDASAPVLVIALQRQHALSIIGQNGKRIEAGVSIAIGGCPGDSVLPSVSTGSLVEFLRKRIPHASIECGTERPRILYQGEGGGVIKLLPKGTNTQRVLCVEQFQCDFVMLISPREFSVRLENPVMIGPEELPSFTSYALIAPKGRADELESSGVTARLRTVLSRAVKELSDVGTSERFLAELAAMKGPSLVSGLARYPEAIPAVAKNSRENIWSADGCFDASMLEATDRFSNMFPGKGTAVPKMRDLIHRSGCIR